MSNGGVKYFPLDVYLDDKFELIEAEFGLIGFAVVVKLYQKIYSIGYYCEWNDDVALLFSKKLGCSAVSEIVSAAIRRGIFDKTLYDKYRILTSSGLQKRYFDIASRWIKVDVKKEYLLIDDVFKYKNVNILTENAYISEKNEYISATNKIKENKIKENKSKRESAPAAHPTRHRYGSYKNVLLSDEDMDKLRAEFSDYQERIERLSEYIASTGRVYKNHLATIRSWARSDQSKPQGKPETVRKNNFNRYSASYSDSDDEALVREITERRRKEREKHDQVNHS